jgi:hypothetical protein
VPSALLHSRPVSAGTTALNVMFNPVAYLTNDEVRNAMDDVIKNIHTNSDFLRSIGHSVLVGTIFNMLVTDLSFPPLARASLS